MQFWITKSGLEIFDLCRAYGFAILLSRSDRREGSPVITDAGGTYAVALDGGEPSNVHLRDNPDWHALFEPGRPPEGYAWDQLFITLKGEAGKRKKRDDARAVLERQFDALLKNAASPGLVASLGRGETLPGPLDPAGFKGLRGRVLSDYSEGQTSVDSLNWALACLGGAVVGRYHWQRQATGGVYYVAFAVPERIGVHNVMDIRRDTSQVRLSYVSLENAAAHYALTVAEHFRQRYAAIGATDRFSGLLYFSLFQAGSGPTAQWKPGGGGWLNLGPLLDLAQRDPHGAAKVFKVWDYLFRRGSTRGSEDLALAITDLVMRPSLDTFEGHVKVFWRYLVKGVKLENLYTEEALKEVAGLVDDR